MTVLTTPRLVLSAPVPEDADDLYEAARQWDVARYTARIPHPYPREEADRFIAAALESWRGGDGAVFLAREAPAPSSGRSSGRSFVGMCGVQLSNGVATLGYFIASEHWGKGYGGEAARAVVAYAFKERHVDRVDAAAVPENAASHRILDRLGMTRTEKVLEDAPARDAPNWVYRYVLSAEEWRRREREKEA